MRLAVASGTAFLRIFGGRAPPDMSRAQAVALGTRHLRQLVKMTAGLPCLPLVETHDDWITTDQIKPLVNPFTAAEVGVIWDVEHPFRKGEAPDVTVAGLGKYLRHVHFKDGLVRGEERLPRLLGEGDVPLKQCHDALRSSGYDGWICLETEKRWHASAPDPAVSLPQFVQYMRKL
jgi:sugar phosphate isomerase/epimerase